MDKNRHLLNRIKKLVEKKALQTKDKIRIEGLLDEDDYGRVVPSKKWNIIPNHPDGSFYGMEGWVTNFCNLMENHPVYVDPNDAFAGRWMYFLSKMRSNIWNPQYPYTHLQDDIKKYDIVPGIGYDAHFAPDYKMGLALGFKGLLEKIEHYKNMNGMEKKPFYDAHKKAIEAIQVWISNTIIEIERLYEIEKDPLRKENLKEMLAVNKNVISSPPKTFREACQWMIWYHLASRTYNRDGAGGQLDALLKPYFDKETNAGTLDRHTVVYYLACFLINDPVYWQLGGPDKDGNDITNELSYLILEAADKINTSINLTIRVHKELDNQFFLQSVKYLVKNKNGWPRYSGDKALVEGFTRLGFTEELARQRIAVGCNWMSLPGLEYTMNDLVKINTAKVFEIAFTRMEQSGEFGTGHLWDLFMEELKKAVAVTVNCILFHLKYQKHNEPELLLNLLSHGPIEKGLDASDRGIGYYNLAIDGAGLATVADSFAALEQRIEQERKITWEQICFHLKDDWQSAEGARVRLLMKNSGRYGQGESLGDKWAQRLSREFTDMVTAHSKKEKHLLFIPGWFSWANTVAFGKAVGATPNGRAAKEAVSHGANPNPGFMKDGASTAMARSIAQIQPGYGNTAPMQLELDPSSAGEDRIETIAALIKGHFNLGGTLLNVNIIDKKTILEAHKNPQHFPDVIVRVTGFTAYFAMLTPEFRQLVVDRILES